MLSQEKSEEKKSEKGREGRERAGRESVVFSRQTTTWEKSTWWHNTAQFHTRFQSWAAALHGPNLVFLTQSKLPVKWKATTRVTVCTIYTASKTFGVCIKCKCQLCKKHQRNLPSDLSQTEEPREVFIHKLFSLEKILENLCQSELLGNPEAHV